MNEFWQSMRDNQDTDKWTPTTEEIYYDQLGAVPPAYHTNLGFVSGEPWSHNNQGQPIYACFVYLDFDVSGDETDTKYAAKYLTLEQFKQVKSWGDVSDD